MHRLRCWLYFAVALLSLTHMVAARAQDGSFDTTWAGGGRIVFPGDLSATDNDTFVDRLIIQGNGDILLGGRDLGNGLFTTRWWLGELTSHGSFVITFGASDGSGLISQCQLEPTECGVPAYGSALAEELQPDGKVVLLGPAGLITRTVANAGQLDTSIGGGNGYTSSAYQINNVQGMFTGASGVVAQPDGKLVAVGLGYYSGVTKSTVYLAIVRLNSDLSLDTSFNATTDNQGATFAGGRLLNVVVGSQAIRSIALAVMADGRIVLVEALDSGAAGATYTSFTVARLNGDGSIDTTFGGGTGLASMTWTGGSLQGSFGKDALVVDRAGRVVLALPVNDTGKIGMLVARMAADGTADSSFGASGFAFQNSFAACSYTFSYAAAIDSAGRIAVGGSCGVEIGIERLRGDTGALDSSFGIAGFSHGAYADNSNVDYVQSMAFDRGGHLVFGGSSEPNVGEAPQEAAVGRITYDLIFTDNFETTPRGCLPPNCN